MRYLVTGATGFAGGALVEKLRHDNHSVRIFIRDKNRADRFLKEGIDVRIGDLRDKNSIVESVKNIDGIFHIAAAFRTAKLPEKAYWEINVEGTRNILEAAVANKIKRVVHCSTIGVHGHVANPPATEEAPFNPGDIYQKTKLEGELLARSFNRMNGLSVVIVRPAGIYGPGDLRFLKLFRAVKRQRFIMLGSGSLFFHPVYIDDLVRGFMLAMQKESVDGQSFIIAGPEYVTLNDLVTKIAAVFRVPPPRLHIPVTPVKIAGYLCELLCMPFEIEPPLHRRRVDFFTKCRAFDITKAKTMLGYVPTVNIDEGISRTADYYIKHGLL